MKALIIKKPGDAVVGTIPEPVDSHESLRLKVRMIGLCGSDLNSFRGSNPLVTFPRIPGHEVAATVVVGSKENPALAAGVNVTMSPYTSCGKCASCLRNRPNACQFNETLGVHRDGALTEYIAMPADKLYAADLSIKELCLVEPLTVDFTPCAWAVTEHDSVAVFGCGGVGQGHCGFTFPRANTIGIDVDDKLALARKTGARHIINTSRESLHQRLLELTNGMGPDVTSKRLVCHKLFVRPSKRSPLPDA
jgi:threonine dehydrogenase-like Zn-dependent dehydrogenase